MSDKLECGHDANLWVDAHDEHDGYCGECERLEDLHQNVEGRYDVE